jgi:hypothetical protein
MIGTSYTGGNVTICPELVGGYYYGILEMGSNVGAPNQWESYWIRSTSLTSGWTIQHKLTGLIFVPGSSVPSPALYRISGKWCCFYCYTGDIDLPEYTKGLPSRCCYAESTDGVTWTKKQPLVGMPDKPLGIYTDQTADPELFEWNGKAYMFCSWMINPPEESYNGSLAIWETGKTLEELVQGI